MNKNPSSAAVFPLPLVFSRNRPPVVLSLIMVSVYKYVCIHCVPVVVVVVEIENFQPGSMATVVTIKHATHVLMFLNV